jgi:hypothetical protein
MFSSFEPTWRWTLSRADSGSGKMKYTFSRLINLVCRDTFSKVWMAGTANNDGLWWVLLQPRKNKILVFRCKKITVVYIWNVVMTVWVVQYRNLQVIGYIIRNPMFRLAVIDSSGIQSSIRWGYNKKKKKKRQEKTFKINIFDDDDSISLLLAKITVI